MLLLERLFHVTLDSSSRLLCTDRARANDETELYAFTTIPWVCVHGYVCVCRCHAELRFGVCRSQQYPILDGESEHIFTQLIWRCTVVAYAFSKFRLAVQHQPIHDGISNTENQFLASHRKMLFTCVFCALPLISSLCHRIPCTNLILPCICISQSIDSFTVHTLWHFINKYVANFHWLQRKGARCLFTKYLLQTVLSRNKIINVQ